MSTEPSGFVGRNEGTAGGTGEGEREYRTLSRLSDFLVGGTTEASSISTSSCRWIDSLSDGDAESDSDSEDSDEDGDPAETTGFAETCDFGFTVVDLSSSEPDELLSEGSEEEAIRLFLFLFRFLAVFVVATAFAALL